MSAESAWLVEVAAIGTSKLMKINYHNKMIPHIIKVINNYYYNNNVLRRMGQANFINESQSTTEDIKLNL